MGTGLGSLRKIECWETIGPARDIFSDSIQPRLISYLRQHSCRLQESDGILNISLFMVGKSVQKTQPTIMFVSSDKQTRKEAFNLVKESGIIHDHPGFEIGHCPLVAEFKGHRQIGEKSSGLSAPLPTLQTGKDPHTAYGSRAEGSSTQQGSPRNVVLYSDGEGDLLCSHLFTQSLEPNGAQRGPSGMVGGLVRWAGNETMALTVNHILPGEINEATNSPSGDTGTGDSAESSDDECEITGLDSADETDEDDSIMETSRGSISTETSASEYASNSSNWLLESGPGNHGRIPDIGTTIPEGKARSSPPSAGVKSQTTYKPTTMMVGKCILFSRSLDYCLVELEASVAYRASTTSKQPILELNQFDKDMSNVWTETPRGESISLWTASCGEVTGTLARYSSYCRLPRTQEFQEVFTAKVNKALSPGDCGSWVYESQTRKLVGHVVAASLDNTIITIMPARNVLRHIVSTLRLPLRSPEPVRGVRFVPGTDQIYSIGRHENEASEAGSIYEKSTSGSRYPRLSKPLELMRSSYDCVVIGSGYGGGVAASRMARTGQSVCVLERGKERWPGEFPTESKEALSQVHYSGEYSAGWLPSKVANDADPTGLYHMIFGAGQNAVVANG